MSRPINTLEFLKQTELIDRIKISQDNSNYFKFRYSNIENTIKRGLDFVNKELNIEREK